MKPIRETESLQCPPSVGGVVNLLRHILNHDDVHSVHIIPGTSVEVDWSHGTGDSLLPERDILPANVLDSVELTGSAGENKNDPFSVRLLTAMDDVSSAGYVPAALLTNDVPALCKLLGLRRLTKDSGTGDSVYAGLRVLQYDVSEGVYVVLGGEVTWSRLDELKYGVVF